MEHLPMKDLQVRDLMYYLSTKTPIVFVWENSESKVINIGDFKNYGNYYITQITGRNVDGAVILKIVETI